MRKHHHPLWRGVLMLVALSLIAISINWFYAPHGVAAGGATGIAILVQEAFGVSVGITTLVVNLIMLGLAWALLTSRQPNESWWEVWSYPCY